MAPLVSILTPVYNRADFLPNAIESVLAQDMGDYELIISDNLSTDGSVEIAERYAQQDKRIKFFRNEEHCSGVENFNLCFHRSDPQSTYIALLASDDWWMPSFLSRMVAIGKQYPDLSFVHADMYRTDETGQVLNRYIDLYPTITPPEGPHQAVRELFAGNYINIMAALINRRERDRLYPSKELFDLSLKLTPDYELWLQLMIRGARAYYCAEPLAYYRKHSDAMTMPSRVIPSMGEHIELFRDRLQGVCPPDLEPLRLREVRRYLTQLGFALLEADQADQAMEPLRESHILGSWKQLDVTVARIITALPGSSRFRRQVWNLARSARNLAGTAH